MGTVIHDLELALPGACSRGVLAASGRSLPHGEGGQP